MKANRLARESSPYLLLHAHNPVDWYPWGEEAFEKARREDKPIFLSVGYSTCYWCHVMERESFSDPEIARQLNDGFVAIKLDREERPDLDEIYMTATQFLTQAGGWPNSVFLTHELKPFFAGTYFPPDDRHGRPGFPRLLTALREAWSFRRAEVVEQAEIVAEAIQRQMAGAGEAGSLPDPEEAARALHELLARRFDREWGGFGPAPKFPSPANLFFLLDRAGEADGSAREMLVVTLDRMARGGICDQLGGGFHRYSTDDEWLVPHFEKMLYDNAALARLYAEAAPLAPGLGFQRVARAALDFVRAELTGAHGAFLSAIDAETDGDEGAYYVWTAQELDAALAPEDRALLAAVYGFDAGPSFEGGRHVLHLPNPLAEQARVMGMAEDALLARLQPGRRALLAARAGRKRPLTDDKILTDWNGLMIGAMARAGALLGERGYVEAAAAAAGFVVDQLVDEASGELRHACRAGQAKVPALLDDYAFLVEGLLELHAATGEARWLDEARRLVREQDLRLWDEAGGGYFFAGEDAYLLVRAKAAHDGAVVSGNGVAARNLIRLAQATGDAAYHERAGRLLRAFGRELREWAITHVTLVQALARLRPEPAPRRTEPAPAPPAPVQSAIEVVTARGALLPGDGPWRRFVLELEIREGWHLNANPPLLRFLVPTEVKAGENDVRSLLYPAADRYEGHVRIEGEVEVRRARPVSVSLTYQACDEERCLAPLTRAVALG